LKDGLDAISAAHKLAFLATFAALAFDPSFDHVHLLLLPVLPSISWPMRLRHRTRPSCVHHRRCNCTTQSIQVPHGGTHGSCDAIVRRKSSWRTYKGIVVHLGAPTPHEGSRDGERHDLRNQRCCLRLPDVRVKSRCSNSEGPKGRGVHLDTTCGMPSCSVAAKQRPTNRLRTDACIRFAWLVMRAEIVNDRRFWAKDFHREVAPMMLRQ